MFLFLREIWFCFGGLTCLSCDFNSKLYDTCINDEEAIFRDEKLRIFGDFERKHIQKQC